MVLLLHVMALFGHMVGWDQFSSPLNQIIYLSGSGPQCIIVCEYITSYGPIWSPGGRAPFSSPLNQIIYLSVPGPQCITVCEYITYYGPLWSPVWEGPIFISS